MACVCYKLPHKEVKADDAFFREKERALYPQTLTLVGDLNHANIYWKGKTAEHKQSGSFLECTDYNFLTQAIEELTRKMLCYTSYLETRNNWLGTGRCGAVGYSMLVRVKGAKRREQGKQQDHNPGPQESRLWPVHVSAWKNSMDLGEKVLQ